MSEKTQKAQPTQIDTATIDAGATFTDDVVIRDTRKVRGSDSWFWSNDLATDSETLIKTDYGENWKTADGKPQARFKVFESDLHTIIFEMHFGGETVKRAIEHAFGRLVVLGQAKERKRIGQIGDEAFAKELAKTNGVLTFEVATAFEPASRKQTDSEKAASSISKIDDEEELKQIELALAAAKQRIKQRRVGGQGA